MRITKYTLDFEDPVQLRELLEAVPVAEAKPRFSSLVMRFTVGKTRRTMSALPSLDALSTTQISARSPETSKPAWIDFRQAAVSSRVL